MSADVSIAILTKNAGPLLERVIAAIGAQETARSVERIALDAGSTDTTPARLARAGFRVESFSPATFNFGIARERLYSFAAGEIIVNLSQDAVPARADWLERLLGPFADADISATCARSIPDPERGFRQFAWERNGRFYFTREIRKFSTRYGRGLSFANSAVRRAAWEKLRFDPIALGEDFQFQTKLFDSGGKIAFVADAPVFHHHNYDLKNLYTRCRNEGAALRELGCPYNALDLARDVFSPGLALQWLRELAAGRMNSPAELLFPIVRPFAVFHGSRKGGELIDYRPETLPDA